MSNKKMSTEQDLITRSGSKCELCSSSENLTGFAIPPNSDGSAEQSILICSTCHTQINNPEEINVNHWRCLNDSMWSQVHPVQVMAWRMLNQLRSEGWAQDLLDMLYLDDQTMAWAQAGLSDQSDEDGVSRHLDSNGVVLEAGDTVTLIKDLNVKGGGFTAKRGTAVRGISLVPDNAEQIEGRVSGQQIVILTKFVKKS